jgi:hypothetical protein
MTTRAKFSFPGILNINRMLEFQRFQRIGIFHLAGSPLRQDGMAQVAVF